MEFRKMVMITLYAKQKKRHRCTEQNFGLCGRRRGWDVWWARFWKIIQHLSGTLVLRASLLAQTVKHLPAMQETWVQSLGWEDPLEKEMAIHSSTLAWKIPWMEEPGRLKSMWSQRVGHDWATSLSFTLVLGRLPVIRDIFFIQWW